MIAELPTTIIDVNNSQSLESAMKTNTIKNAN